MGKPPSSKPLRLLTAGGDLRQMTAAKRLSAVYHVSVIGFERFGTLPEGLSPFADEAAAFDALLLPMPITQDGVFLHAPYADKAISLPTLLKAVKPGAPVFGGRITTAEQQLLESAGLRVFDYAKRETFAIRNAVPTAEGTLQIAMQELPVTLHRLPCLILGAGRLSRALQPRLQALGAEVTVAARRCSDLAWSECCVGKPHFSGMTKPAHCCTGFVTHISKEDLLSK